VHDVETFIYAISFVYQFYPRARFVIVGDGVERAKFEKLVDKLAIRNVTIFAGMVEEDRMLRLLQMSDIYVSTSKLDAGLAASTAEAMAVGLPVIQTDNSDNKYWTPNGEGGILIPNSDPKALSDAILKLISDGALRKKMGIHNRNKVMVEYNMDIEMSKIEEQYKLLK
jgi:glycosyltransferase involved in cell wall biosynthesis